MPRLASFASRVFRVFVASARPLLVPGLLQFVSARPSTTFLYQLIQKMIQKTFFVSTDTKTFLYQLIQKMIQKHVFVSIDTKNVLVSIDTKKAASRRRVCQKRGETGDRAQAVSLYGCRGPYKGSPFCDFDTILVLFIRF